MKTIIYGVMVPAFVAFLVLTWLINYQISDKGKKNPLRIKAVIALINCLLCIPLLGPATYYVVKAINSEPGYDPDLGAGALWIITAIGITLYLLSINELPILIEWFKQRLKKAQN